MHQQRLTPDQIRARAYEIFRQRGGQPGHEMDDWLQAEYELMQLPIHQIAKLRPPKPRAARYRQPALVSLVQAALLLGGSALSPFK